MVGNKGESVWVGLASSGEGLGPRREDQPSVFSVAETKCLKLDAYEEKRFSSLVWETQVPGRVCHLWGLKADGIKADGIVGV